MEDLIFCISVLWPFILLFGAYIGYAVISIITDKRNKEFMGFLNANANEILYGNGSEFRGQIYTKETMLVRYRMCISYLIMTSSQYTYYMPYDKSKKFAVLTFLITLIGGWWGFPWGPIKTIDTFIKNAGHDGMASVYDIYREFTSQE
ncbi:MAG: hypothetical protein ACI4J0_00095 [Huintestinicola sp.]|uniref:hypothetical protein n=1 Tax=Huintestinicola sp. TaxID=2981661 RepID=UPI003F0ABA1E